LRVATRGTVAVAVFVTLSPVMCPAASVMAASIAVSAAREDGCRSAVPATAAPVGVVPYAQNRYDFDRVRAFADGRGIRVAVIDSGVDDTHRQLRGQVTEGADFLYGTSDGRRDCVGHGTGVASIIAAKPSLTDGKRLRGLAPAATIVPVRVSEQELIDGRNPGKSIGGDELAEAIDWAAATGGGKGNATVINLSLTTTEDFRPVRLAVQRAIAGGVVIVAAVGNLGAEGNPTPFPAAYPGVIGVGAIGEDGVLQPFSQRGPYVDVVAPGGKVIAANARHGYQLAEGTSYAAPFVAATAALIRQRFPHLSPVQVQQRIEETADPAPDGRRSEAYGRGVLNPYRAVTETLSVPAVKPRRVLPLPTTDPAVAAAERRRSEAWSRSLRYAGTGGVVVLLTVAAALIIPRGRRRGWRPADS
jgi:membrane-anchored mycosin MYCP